ELARAHDRDAHRRARDDRRRATLVFEQRDLAEEVTGPERRERFAVLRDLDLPLQDDEELVREPALLQQRVPRREADRIRPPRDPLAIFVTEIGEQRDLLEVVCVHGRIVPRVSTWAPPAPC